MFIHFLILIPNNISHKNSIITNGKYKGEVTNHHDHVITLHSFNIKNIINNNPQIPKSRFNFIFYPSNFLIQSNSVRLKAIRFQAVP